MLELNVLGRKVAVRFIGDKELEKLGGDTDLLGLFYRGTIYISSSLPQEEVKRVLLHELSHAILEVTGLHNLFEDGEQDAICDAFESMLDVFRTPEIVKFLNESEGAE